MQYTKKAEILCFAFQTPPSSWVPNDTFIAFLLSEVSMSIACKIKYTKKTKILHCAFQMPPS